MADNWLLYGHFVTTTLGPENGRTLKCPVIQSICMPPLSISGFPRVGRIFSELTPSVRASLATLFIFPVISAVFQLDKPFASLPQGRDIRRIFNRKLIVLLAPIVHLCGQSFTVSRFLSASRHYRLDYRCVCVHCSSPFSLPLLVNGLYPASLPLPLI